MDMIAFAAAGVAAMYVVSRINYQHFRWMAPLILGGSIVLLILCYIPGLNAPINDVRRWLKIFLVAGPTYQPSEIAKICYIFAGSATLERLFRKRNLTLFIVLTGVCVGLLGLMSDFGTAAVFFVGNRLMLDDGVGPAAYDEIVAAYDIPDNVTLLDVGCMALDMLSYVDRCDLILTVDAVDGTGDAPGTVYRFEPEAMARHSGPEASLHDLKLVDLFDAASLMGYEAEGYCLGMQVGNPSPEQFCVGLTPECAAALPLLVETVVAELSRRGFPLTRKD